MKAEVLSMLAGATLALSLAVLLVLGLRSTVRRMLGPVTAYRLWLLVPAVMLATCLPGWMPATDAAGSTMTTVRVIAAAARTQVPMPDAGWQALLLAVWAMGVGLTLTMFFWQQARFVRSLGRLQIIDAGVYRASASQGGPALIGALAPRIILPAGFEQDYTRQQQELILLHERTHLRRGDARSMR